MRPDVFAAQVRAAGPYLGHPYTPADQQQADEPEGEHP